MDEQLESKNLCCRVKANWGPVRRDRKQIVPNMHGFPGCICKGAVMRKIILLYWPSSHSGFWPPTSLQIFENRVYQLEQGLPEVCGHEATPTALPNSDGKTALVLNPTVASTSVVQPLKPRSLRPCWEVDKQALENHDTVTTLILEVQMEVQ